MIFELFFIEKIKSHVLTVPSFTHTFSCIHTKTNLYLVNSLAAVVSDPNLCRLQIFNLPKLMSMLHCLGCTKGSIHAWNTCIHFLTRPIFRMRCCYHIAQPPSWRTIPCRMSETAYSMYSHLPSILGTVPPFTNWGRVMPWCQGLLVDSESLNNI